MNDTVLGGLLAHELAHLRRWHQGFHLLGALVLPSIIIWGCYKFIIGLGYPAALILPPLIIVGISLSALLYYPLSRYFEYDADRMAAQYLNDTAPVIAMVEHSVADESDHESAPSPGARSQDGHTRSGVDRLRGLFTTHPSNEDRVARLEQLSIHNSNK
jgi:Zn-dependent protease with chaperone function